MADGWKGWHGLAKQGRGDGRSGSRASLPLHLARTLWNRLTTFRRSYTVAGAVCCTFIIFAILVGAASSGGAAGWLAVAVLCAGALIAGAMFVVSIQCRRLSSSLDNICDRLDGLESALAQQRVAQSERQDAGEIDLAKFGVGNLGALVAGRLDRSLPPGFPRLVPRSEIEDAADVAEPDLRELAAHRGPQGPLHAPTPNAHGSSPSPGLGRLLEKWDCVVEEGDLANCRAIYATLADLVDAPTLRRLGHDLQRLADANETALRAEFAECHRHGDVAGMLAVGRRICALLPDRAVAEEFRRIEPRLRKRIVLHKPDKEPGLRMGP